MQERKQNMVKRKNPFIRITALLVPLVVLLLLSQTVFAQNTYVITDGARVLVHTSSATDPAAVLNDIWGFLFNSTPYVVEIVTFVNIISRIM